MTKSLFLATVAVLGMATAAQAADPIVINLNNLTRIGTESAQFVNIAVNNENLTAAHTFTVNGSVLSSTANTYAAGEENITGAATNEAIASATTTGTSLTVVGATNSADMIVAVNDTVSGATAGGANANYDSVGPLTGAVYGNFAFNQGNLDGTTTVLATNVALGATGVYESTVVGAAVSGTVAAGVDPTGFEVIVDN